MDLDYTLKFTEICRCCKRTESGMTSIFNEYVYPTHHTFPPVKEMLRTIASLNVQENDGLPSHVCTSCLNNIQDSFTFILRLIQIDEELSLILATREQADTLPPLSQSTYETNQYSILTDFVKKEDVNDSLKVEDLDESMLNFYQLRSDNLVKLELDQDASGNVDEPLTKVENEEISNLGDPSYHGPDEEKDISLETEYTFSGNENLSVNDDDGFSMVQKAEEMEDFEDIDEIGKDSTDDESNLDEAEAPGDCQENNEDGNSVDSSDAARKLRTKRRKTNSNLIGGPVLRCKLCAYANPYMSNLKRHFKTHIDSSFICSKCNSTFTRRNNMLCHWSKCNGEASMYAVNGQHRKRASKGALILQDIEDPLKMKEYYTEEQQNDDDDLNVELEDTSKLSMLKCNLCDFTNVYMSNLKRHLLTHSKDKPSFTCSKCNLTFRRNDYMQQHWRKCNGEISRYALSARQVRYGRNGNGPKRVVVLTLQDLKDPEKIKELYTEVDVQNNDDNEDVKGKSPEDGRDVVEIGDTTKPTMLKQFKCNLCNFTNAYMSKLKLHLLTHSKDKPSFNCSKCNLTFRRNDYMQRHWRKCNGEISRYAASARKGRYGRNGKGPKRLVALALQDLKDPEKMKQLYTEVDVQNNDDNENVKVKSTEAGGDVVEIGDTTKRTMLKCNLCDFTNVYMSNLKRHLLTHSKDKPSFTCSKCNLTFRRNDYMQRHWRKCNGEISRYALNARQVRSRGNKWWPKRVVALTLQDLEDESKIKEYYTEIEVPCNDDDENVTS